MIRLNIHEAKTHLSRYLDRLLGGETILLCRRNVPIAEIRALPPSRSEPRPLGLGRGDFTIPAEFFASLPAAEVAGFEGEGA
jgi:antitoxin (DNA-binding transcriptional repressor) of toxin-antitoxin stability system